MTPVLGGGQSGGGLAFTPNPLARRPFAVTVRDNLAHDDAGRSAVAAVVVAWHPFAGVTVAAERLVPLGPAARGDWKERITGGVVRRVGIVEGTAYGEAGVVGRATYSAAQARAGAQLLDGAVSQGVGAWASAQRGSGTTVDRIDLGPGVAVRAHGVALPLDYRFRVAGNAAPGSGPVLTLSTAF